MTTVNIEELISFYDEQTAAQPHSSAIKGFAGEEFGIALLKHYFLKEFGATAELLTEPNTINRRACTTGKRRGYQLDGWLKVKSDYAPSTAVLYQLEIKSWSFHGIGGKNRNVELHCSGRALLSRKQVLWEHYWDSKTFREDKVRKVLAKMAHPKDERDNVRPLLCLWEAVHPPGDEDRGPWFHVKIKEEQTFEKKNVSSGRFNEVYVFSMSAYLRNLCENGNSLIELELPNTTTRVAWLSRILPGVSFNRETGTQHAIEASHPLP